MKYSDSFYKMIIFTTEILASALLLFGGYVILKKYDNLITLGVVCFYIGSLTIISFLLHDYNKEFSCLNAQKTILVVDVIIILSTSYLLLTTFGYSVEISEILIRDLRNIRIITGKTRILFWISTRVEKLFGCCRIFDMIDYGIYNYQQSCCDFLTDIECSNPLLVCKNLQFIILFINIPVILLFSIKIFANLSKIKIIKRQKLHLIVL
ncbi:unnamed protein product [Chironomus riparius]|uniref:Uncharacterized protein n=1 Tax=Chironomus riparius TaxID=315576 RepID=A0A9N9S295_9DIPT|nr:unnamed protein product [Chironomus riparius]